MTDIVNDAGTIAARIERLPLSRWHVKVRLLIGVVTFFDGFDQLLIAYALPAIRKQYTLDTADVTLTITAGSVGMLVGAALSGYLADRAGRVRTLTWCLLLYALTSALAAAAPEIGWLQAARFLQGVGIGGEVLVAAAYINEIVGATRRGRYVLVYELAFVFGLAAASLVSTWVVPAFGWRVLFLIGALPVVLAFVLPRQVPESPRWLAARGRTAEASGIVDELERRAVAQFGTLPEVAPVAVAPAPRPRLADLFTGRYLRRTLVVSVLWFVAFLVNYGLTSWLPTIYTTVYHLPLDTSLRYSMITMAAGLVGCVVLALTVDRVGRRPGLAVCLLGGALVLGVAAWVHPATGYGVMLFVSAASIFVFAVNLGLNLYGPELYPTRSRALGASVGGIFARLGVIAGPVLTGALVDTGGIAPVFAVLAAAGALGGLVLVFFGVETARRPLESLSP
ncbi:MFS transporter [Amycolatopsis sp. NPDC059027]|uniref:MFS transporter n=1 Tax=unclassified Amycolatopsis TaxID=2618356 RepID=UPI003670504E